VVVGGEGWIETWGVGIVELRMEEGSNLLPFWRRGTRVIATGRRRRSWMMMGIELGLS